MSIEFIAQEFWDYVSESATPVALKMMEGNFLFVEIADLDFIVAQLDTTSTTSVYAPASTDYATVAEYLTGNLTDFNNEQFSELISTWNATVTGGGGATGATLLAGTYHTLVDGNSYPKEFVGSVDSLILSLDGVNALTFTASSIDWTDTVELTLPTGTVFDFQVNESGEVEPCLIEMLEGFTTGLLQTSTGDEVTQELPTNWGDSESIATALADPEYVFPFAIVYWEMQMQWARDRMRAIKRYVEHTVGAQNVTYETIDYIANPFVVRNWTTGNATVRSAPSGDVVVTDGAALPFATTITNLGEMAIPRSLSPEHYDFENEQLYMYKSVLEYDIWTLNVTCICSTVSSPDTYDFVATEAAYVVYNGTYASKAALEAAIGGGSAIWEADPTNAWSRAYRNSGLVTVGRVCRTLAVGLRIRYSIDRTTRELDPCQYAVVAKITLNDHYLWDADLEEWDVDPDWPGTTPITLDACVTTPNVPTFRGFPINSPYGGTTFAGQTIPSLTVDGVPLVMPTDDIEFPATTFNLQNGTPAPVYPTYQGAFVYDLELKKWGKMKMSFLSLLDFAPVNTQSSQLLPNARYGVAGGILDSNGAIYQWDANPTDAYIKYGKFSLFRLGVTTIQEIEAQFGIQSTGTLETETSLDGKTIDLSLSTSYDFEGARVVRAPISKAGVWHNIILRGQFDLTYLQVNAYRSGRR